jgi:transposase InsO family protein
MAGWSDLVEAGERVGQNRVARQMRQSGIEALRRRKRRPVDEGVRSECAVSANALDRDFDAEGPNRRWVADVTYVDTAEGWLYVAVVLDLFSRRVVGWSMRAEITAQFVTDALTMALWRRGRTKALLHHSDQGSQYAVEHFQRLLAHHGIACSMRRKGDCWDNAEMESFFASLKKERIYTKPRYRTRDEARADIFQYFEGFYKFATSPLEARTGQSGGIRTAILNPAYLSELSGESGEFQPRLHVRNPIVCASHADRCTADMRRYRQTPVVRPTPGEARHRPGVDL